MSTFGSFTSMATVEQYILDLAEKWFPEYIAETERQLGEPPETYPDLRDYGVANEFDKWPEEHLPFLLAMYTGLSEQPRRDGEGTYSVRALFACAIIVATNSKVETRKAAHAYATAFRPMMLQHQDLEHPEKIGGMSFVYERPAPIPEDGARSLMAMNMHFVIDVKDILSENGVPPEPEPRPDPYVPPGELGIILPEDPDNPTTPRGGVTIEERATTP